MFYNVTKSCEYWKSTIVYIIHFPEMALAINPVEGKSVFTHWTGL